MQLPITHPRVQDFSLLRHVLIMETLRAYSPRPLSPYSDADHPGTARDKERSHLAISIVESENPFSDEHEIDATPTRRLSLRLPGCVRWSLRALVEEIKALVSCGVGSRYKRLGIKSADGGFPSLSSRLYWSLPVTESRTPVWKGGSGAYIPMGTSSTRINRVGDHTV